jgi:hypothetical protein
MLRLLTFQDNVNVTNKSIVALLKKLGMVVHRCKLSTREAEAGSQIRGQLGLHSQTFSSKK